MKILLGLALLLAVVTPVLANEMVTICHAAGRDGTTHYVTLTVNEHALAGHFDNDGTPRAGHEDDYFGPCVTEPTATPEPTGSPEPSPSGSALPSVEPTPTPSPEPTVVPTEEAAPSPVILIPDTAMNEDNN